MRDERGADALLAPVGGRAFAGGRGLAADPALKIQFASDRIQVAASADLAYARGHYNMKINDPAARKPAASGGSYLTVWRKQADGGWKAVEDFVTPGAGAGQAS
jgi:ketosteroid isomerase-like protein